jgi:hypothetical protein
MRAISCLQPAGLARCFNLKTEIRNGQMSQHVGAQTHWKKRSDIGTNLARFFQCVCAQEVAADGRFQFRFSGLEWFCPAAHENRI